MTNPKEAYIIALDPGSDKCGYAIVHLDLSPGEMGVVYLAELNRLLSRLVVEPFPEAIVLGKGTASKTVSNLIGDMNLPVDLCFGDEQNTTFEARARYFADHPPKGLWRLVPLGLQLPPRPIDDYAALLIGERYLRTHNLNPESA